MVLFPHIFCIRDIIFWEASVKKSIIAACLCVFGATNAFALNLSLGVAGSYQPITSNYQYSYDILSLASIKGSSVTSLPLGNFKVFADMEYLALSLGYSSAEDGSTVVSLNGHDTTTSNSDTYEWLTLEALGKVPVKVGKLVLFPMAGIEYDYNLSYKDEDGNDLKDNLSSLAASGLDQFWLKGGLGADLKVGRFFIRPAVLFGYKIPSDYDGDVVSDSISGFDLIGSDVSVSLTNTKWEFSLGIGYDL
jgi:hypothetical protein